MAEDNLLEVSLAHGVEVEVLRQQLPESLGLSRIVVAGLSRLR